MIQIDMEMPRGCYECPFGDESFQLESNYYCQAAKKDVAYGLSKPDLCPLINVSDYSDKKSETSDLISRRAAIEVADAIWTVTGDKNVAKVWQQLKDLPSVQPEPCDDPRADVYYLAEKIGIHRLYALVVELRGEPELCEDQAARRLNNLIFDINPAEICSQIRSDNLRNWCKTIQTEMKMAMVKLPCWEERKTDG